MDASGARRAAARLVRSYLCAPDVVDVTEYSARAASYLRGVGPHPCLEAAYELALKDARELSAFAPAAAPPSPAPPSGQLSAAQKQAAAEAAAAKAKAEAEKPPRLTPSAECVSVRT